MLALALQLLVGLLVFTPTPAQAETTPPQIAAPAAIAVDVASGRIIYSKNMHRRVPMASTTKIMTALTAFSISGTSLSETYTVSKDDLVGEASIPLHEGEVISFQDLLWGTLMNSGNDGATAIARYAGSKLPGAGDPVTKFVAQMNTYAASLGMRNSHYTNPHGLDADNHYSSAFDLAISGWYLLKNPLLKQIVATQSATVAEHPLNNLNKFLKAYPGTNGIKPGYTDNAGLCLVASATKDNTTIISVILGEDAVAYNADPPLLFNYGFAQLKNPTFLQSIQQGASAATAADYIGRPNGDKLVVFNAPGDNGVINAQINQVGGTPGPTVSTQFNGNSASATDPNAKGGINIFTILLAILILLGLVYVALRFTPLGGEKGRNFAYSLEDVAAKGLHGIRRFWQYLKPGAHEDEPGKPPTPKPAKQVSVSLNSAPDSRTRLPGKGAVPTPGRNAQTAPGTLPGTQSPYRPTGTGEGQRIFGTTAGTGVGSSEVSREPQSSASSFESMFEDESSFSFEAENLENTGFADGLGPDAGTSPQPPRPLSGRPGPDFSTRPIPEAPPSKSSIPSQRTQPMVRPISPPQSTRPTPTVGNYGTNNPGREPDKAPASSSQGTSGNRSSEAFTSRAATPGQPDSVENVAIHARQAIDYAYAGRLSASTEEFRRVIEQSPLFDFGTIDEFEQMPVLGYKALAGAYRDAGKAKFAILLLDMAVENFPNELELRNMLRHLRRDVE